MEISDTYRTIQTEATAQLTEKRSRFLAFAMPVQSEAEIKEQLAALRKKYYDARHICYAYILGETGEAQRANDDGEPSGTAGRPILGQLISRKLTYTLVAVVRYFGGVKLGTGPLGVAYKTAAADVLQNATIETRIITQQLRISLPYADADTAMRFVREAGAEITTRDFTATHTSLTIKVRKRDAAPLQERLAHIRSLVFADGKA